MHVWCGGNPSQLGSPELKTRLDRRNRKTFADSLKNPEYDFFTVFTLFCRALNRDAVELESSHVLYFAIGARTCEICKTIYTTKMSTYTVLYVHVASWAMAPGTAGGATLLSSPPPSGVLSGGTRSHSRRLSSSWRHLCQWRSVRVAGLWLQRICQNWYEG